MMEISIRTMPARAALVDCGECMAFAGGECDGLDGAFHLARYARANRRGLISDRAFRSLMRIIGDIFGSCMVVPDSLASRVVLIEKLPPEALSNAGVKS